MRCRALAVLLLWAAAAQADDLVLQTADRVVDAQHGGDTDRLEGLAARGRADPWLVAEELCSRGAHDVAAAFAAAAKDEKLGAYVASRRGKEPDTDARRALGEAHRLRIQNYGEEAWGILSGIERTDDPVLAVRLCATRAKTLRDLGKHADSERWFLESGKLAHKLGWRRRTTESLCYLAYWHCLGTGRGASEMWLIRKRLEPGQAVVVYGRPAKELLATVITPGRTWYVPLGELAPIQAALAEYRRPRVGTSVLVDELRARLVAPLGLGNEIERVFVVPIKPFVDLPWVLLLGDREVVLGHEASRVSAFGDRVLAFGEREPDHGEGVLAVGRSRSAGNTAAEQEARAVGDTVLLGERATWEAVEEVTAAWPHVRALHVVCPSRVAQVWFSPDFGVGMRLDSGKQSHAWLPEGEPELVVLSVDESWRLVYAPEGRRGPALRAPRVIVSLWSVDPEATQALMRRFYALWNGRVSLPACTALKLAQDFVRSQPVWKHPYYWAGWQLWASQEPVASRKGGS